MEDSSRGRDNPMRTAREEDARTLTRESAFRFALPVIVAWAELDASGTPVGVASTLSAASDADKGVDAWGTPFSIRYGTEPLVEDEAATQLFMELLSAGADGEAGTNDDIAFWVSMTGEFHDGAHQDDDTD